MYILSIDVGIRNMGCCVLKQGTDGAWLIHQWKIMTICDIASTTHPCCQYKGKKGTSSCSKNATYCSKSIALCTTHLKSTKNHEKNTCTLKSLMQNSESYETLCEKWSFTDVFATPAAAAIPQTKATKNKQMKLLHAHILQHGFKKIKKKRADEEDLMSLSCNLSFELKKLWEEGGKVQWEHVLIENQRSSSTFQQGVKIKNLQIQAMICQFFSQAAYMLTQAPVNNQNIHIVSAVHKLSAAHGKKNEKNDGDCENNYSMRKRQSTEELHKELSNPKNTEWATFFEGHKKKDDLADCFLQAQWFISRL